MLGKPSAQRKRYWDGHTYLNCCKMPDLNAMERRVATQRSWAGVGRHQGAFLFPNVPLRPRLILTAGKLDRERQPN
ncbi:hypothetical protein FPSE_09671 [Fusarium pseudograminearum CS3096]|uniref:Uncharacterized protein n=1 Tax=Fusarium pseudograminearum (strain CS3096) TaxID=1028729 RepID=K3VY72_FUSPC|nr:hypothetical protein FPSE_09671 [Fusarium pseudograminearum CS3096]EKJ70145.1 hypothetical protein FPSE_09671 [Fusarium pseudograminearum CS3096]